MTEENPAVPPMSPGTYMRKRREAAGLDLDRLSLMVAARHGDQSLGIAGSYAAARAYHRQIERLERDEPGDYLVLVDELRGAFHFDLGVYQHLVLLQADSSLPCSPICRRCACTWMDACVDELRRTCCWVSVPEGEPPLCSHCRDRGPNPGERMPVPANDGETRNAA